MAMTMGNFQESSYGPFEPRIGRSVSLDQACQILQVSRRTVYNWIREGRLQTIRTLGGSQRVLVASVRHEAGHIRALSVGL
jgi:excisionase family DNA binding protein